jgi:NADH:ubiquinone oxidoreductase subunit 4 (subunit M)
MNFVTLGVFSLNIYSIEGSIMLMLSHGLVSSALFICIGILYDRYHTRLMKYYGGLVVTMPIFSSFFLIFILANLSFPTTSSFIGEFLILLGAFKNNTIITFLASFSIILSCIYSM